MGRASASGSPQMEGHVKDQPREFFIRLYKPVCGHLRLHTPFGREMELDLPQALRLHMRGCGNSGMRVDIDFPAPQIMYLRHGWKTLARSHSLLERHVLQFKLMENGLLSVKVFGDLGTHLKCCVESSSDGDSDDGSSSSSESDEEDSGADGGDESD